MKLPLLILAIVSVACAAIVGCHPKKDIPPASPSTGLARGTAKIETLAQDVKRNAEVVEKKSTGEDKVRLGSILWDTSGILDEVPTVNAEVERLNKALMDSEQDATEKAAQIDSLKGEVKALEQYNDNRWVGDKAFRFMHRGLLIIAIALGLIVVLRVVGVMNHGWIGTAASLFGVFISGVLTGGISLIGEFFSNLHFRSVWTPPAIGVK